MIKEINIPELSKEINMMEQDILNLLLVTFIKENLKIVCNMVLELVTGRMEKPMKVDG